MQNNMNFLNETLDCEKRADHSSLFVALFSIFHTFPYILSFPFILIYGGNILLLVPNNSRRYCGRENAL